ncbi:MAG: AAA family ATPase [Thiobacillus sp.]|nr:AAA family ATPase [Thiobacillus sp.]MDP2056964.1 AAA family ATPase [Thiobacillus sp.]
MIDWWRHFGLREPPFGLTPDTSFFFPALPYQEAHETLLYALSAGEGFLAVEGEVGTGKTLLLRRLLNSLPERWQVAFVPNPGLDPRGLYAAIAIEFGVPADGASEDLLHRLERHFIALAQQERQPVVLIDEAQALPADTLEAVRLLTNLETEKRKLLQVVLFGQPELMARLREKNTRQILTRISFHANLRPLDRHEVAAYVQHRLKVAGGGGALFTWWAEHALWRVSRGLPRLVNIIAAKAMMLAYGRGTRQVTCRHVMAAARDTLAARKSVSIATLAWGLALLGLTAAAAAGWRLLG